jgi:hypothetical protein
MAPLPPPPEHAVQVRVTGVISTVNWGVQFWLDATTDATEAELATAAGAISTSFHTDLGPFMGGSYEVTETALRQWQAGGDVLQGQDFTTWSGGDTGGSPNPSSACAVIQWHPYPSYRGGKPKMYLPGANDDKNLSPRQWTDAYVTDLAAAAVDFIEAMTADVTGLGSCVPSFLERIRDKEPLATPILRHITGATVQPRICSQRRRLGKLIP